MSSLPFPSRVRIVEVGPRDGLQNEPEVIATSDKLTFIGRLLSAGLRDLEVTSFVHPQVVPQLADADDVVRGLPRGERVVFSGLVPNLKGLGRAIQSGLQRIAVFAAASETFSKKNIRMTIAESMDVFEEVAAQALQNGVSVRGYLSTAFVCPYEGPVDKHRVRELAERLLALGVDEVAVSDTVGAAAPGDVIEIVGHMLEAVPARRIALHFHDTCGTALANVLTGLQLGVTTFDAAAGGLGGCPFAPGAAGNVATEDLVYMLQRMGIDTGVDLEKLAAASEFMEQTLGRRLQSRQLQRLKACRAAPGVARKDRSH